MLVGLAEVWWSYKMPDFDESWRAVLPASLGGLALFTLTAVVTDVAACLCLFTVAWAVFGLLGRLGLHGRRGPTPRESPPSAAPTAPSSEPVASCPRQPAQAPPPKGRRKSERRFAALWLVLTVGLSYLYVGWQGLFFMPADESGNAAYLAVMAMGIIGAAMLAALLAGLLSLARSRIRWAGQLAVCLAAVAIIVATLPAFGRYRRADQTHLDVPVASEPGPRPNILFVTIDTLRCDYVRCCGNAWIKTPTLDGLAADGVFFEYAISQAPTTTPSHCSIMTSVYPNAHRAFNGKPMRRGFTTIADVLRANGYETTAFVASTTVRSINSGLQQGFDDYVDSLVPWSTVFSRDEFQNLIFFYLAGLAQDSQLRGEIVTDRALAWLVKRPTDKPFFVWLHYFDPHDPYAAPEPFGSMYRGTLARDGLPMPADREAYAGEVTYADHELGRFLDEVKRRSLYQDLLVVVVSDHGEAFGEQHWHYTDVRHGGHLYDPTQRVPLVFKMPGGIGSGRRVTTQVETTDIAPTILKLLHIGPPAGFVGRPLDELIENRPYAHRGGLAYSTTFVQANDPSDPSGQSFFVQRMACRSPDWKYLFTTHFDLEELYDLANDPRERRNVASAYQSICAERRARVTAVLKEEHDDLVDPRLRVNPAMRRQLKSLGYIGGDDEEPHDDESAGGT